VGTFAVSTAAPLIKLAVVPAIAIAAWRTLGCGALYALFAPAQLARLRELSRRDLGRALVGSGLMGAHFALWISAFDHTSYASTVLLLVTQPVFGALLGRVVLGERMHRGMLLAIGGATVGLALLVHGDLSEPGGLLGDALAVAGSLALAAYYLTVRPLRKTLPFAPFMALSYGVAGALLAGLALATGTPMAGFTAASWGWLATLVLLPTVVGHACFNWAIPRVRFFTLNLLIVLEPAIAILLGALLLDERPTALQLGGGLVLGAAVVLGLRRSPAVGTAEAADG
jgi:drug/metabolite transporter (DMT)-like permease